MSFLVQRKDTVAPHAGERCHWQKVTSCEDCGLTGKFTSCHPASPCRRCGRELRELTGRWRPDPYPWWGPFLLRRPTGCWEVKG
jgi:hypothetical protein